MGFGTSSNVKDVHLPGKRDRTVFTTKLIVPPEKRMEFFQTLSSLTKKFRAQPGCTAYQIYEETGDENSLILVGEWDTKANWESHRRSGDFAVFVGAVQVLSVRTKIDFKLLMQVSGNEAMLNG